MSDEKYKNGKIYTLRCYKTEDNKFIDVSNYIYVGSTCNPLYKRFYIHKQAALDSNKYKSKLYETMRETFFNYNYIWKIELYENFPCSSRNELLKREGEIIRLLKPFLNSNIAGRKEKTGEGKQVDKIKTKERIKNKLEIDEDIKNVFEEIKNKIGFEKNLIVERKEINDLNKNLQDKRDDIYKKLNLRCRVKTNLNFKTTLDLINLLYKFHNKKIIGNKETYNKKFKTYNNYIIVDIEQNL